MVSRWILSPNQNDHDQSHESEELNVFFTSNRFIFEPYWLWVFCHSHHDHNEREKKKNMWICGIWSSESYKSIFWFIRVACLIYLKFTNDLKWFFAGPSASSSGGVHYWCSGKPTNKHTTIPSYKVCKVFAFALYLLLRMHDWRKQKNVQTKLGDALPPSQMEYEMGNHSHVGFLKLFEKRGRTDENATGPAYMYSHERPRSTANKLWIQTEPNHRLVHWRIIIVDISND